jgi:hypothetical protein
MVSSACLRSEFRRVSRDRPEDSLARIEHRENGADSQKNYVRQEFEFHFKSQSRMRCKSSFSKLHNEEITVCFHKTPFGFP